MIAKKMNKFVFNNCSGFTLAELMVAALVLVTILVALLASYVIFFDLNETSRNTTTALYAAQEKMEEIRSYASSSRANFLNTCNEYTTNNTFTVSDMPAEQSMGVIYARVDQELNSCTGAACNCNFNYDVLRIIISVSWRQKSGRLIGEDKNLDGVLDSGEDANGSGLLDSPAQIVTLLVEE